jgi:hypothetical protein
VEEVLCGGEHYEGIQAICKVGTSSKHLSVDCTNYPINKMIKLTKKAIELLEVVTSVPYSRKGLGYTWFCAGGSHILRYLSNFH